MTECLVAIGSVFYRLGFNARNPGVSKRLVRRVMAGKKVKQNPELERGYMLFHNLSVFGVPETALKRWLLLQWGKGRWHARKGIDEIRRTTGMSSDMSLEELAVGAMRVHLDTFGQKKGLLRTT
jgi:hypothetical protein